MDQDHYELKVLFLCSLTYVEKIFDHKFLQEWVKQNKLHLTWGRNALLTEEQFNEWMDEWLERK